MIVTILRVYFLVIILMEACISSYIVFFLPNNDEKYSNGLFLIDMLADFSYIIEILSQFNICYYHQGELRSSRSEISMHYLTTRFGFDAITQMSLMGRFFRHSRWESLMLLTALRLYKVPSLISALEDYFQFSKEISCMIRVIKLSLIIILFAHFVACIFFEITVWDPNEESWLVKAQLQNASETEIYVVSLYWSITVMATVGFGDITPTNVHERIFAIMLMIISSILFGYVLSTIGNLLLELDSFSTESKEKIRTFTKYMNEKGLNKNMQNKIRKYLEFYLNKENSARMENDKIKETLSQNLQDELVREINAKIMSDTYMFYTNFRKSFIYIVSKDLVERSFGPEETIYNVRVLVINAIFTLH